MKHSTNKARKGARTSRKVIPVLFIAVFAVILYATALIAAVMPKQTVSASENRVLELMPKFSFSALFSGSYTESYEKYYSDTFPLRDTLTDAAHSLEELRGIRGEDDAVIYDGSKDDSGKEGTDVNAEEKKRVYEAYLYRNAAVEPMEQSAPAKPLVYGKGSDGGEGGEQSELPDDNPVDNPLENEEGNYVNNIFVIGNTAFEIFGRNDTAGSAYAAIINKWRAKLPDSVSVYNLIVPKNSAFSLPEKYSSMNGDQREGIEHIYSELSPGVTPVRVFDALYSRRGEYIFFRTDHHWTQRGAYYAYREFAKAAGFDALSESDFDVVNFEGYLGTLYNATKDKRLSAEPDYVEAWYAKGKSFSMTYYTSSLVKCNRNYIIRTKPTSARNSYGVFIDGDNPLTIIKNPDVTNGRKIVVVKESYGNCFVPFLANHFEEVYVVDQRYYNKLVDAGQYPKLAKLIEREGVTDVLFINNMQAALGGLKGYIEKLL